MVNPRVQPARAGPVRRLGRGGARATELLGFVGLGEYVSSARHRAVLRAEEAGGARAGPDARPRRRPARRAGSRHQPHAAPPPRRADPGAQRRPGGPSSIVEHDMQFVLSLADRRHGPDPRPGASPPAPPSGSAATRRSSRPTWARTSPSHRSRTEHEDDRIPGRPGGLRRWRRPPRARPHRANQAASPASSGRTAPASPRCCARSAASCGRGPARSCSTGSRSRAGRRRRCIAAGVAQVPQQGGLFGNLTVRDNMLLGGYLHRRDRRALLRRIDELAETFPTVARAGAGQGGGPVGRPAPDRRVRPRSDDPALRRAARRADPRPGPRRPARSCSRRRARSTTWGRRC